VLQRRTSPESPGPCRDTDEESQQVTEVCWPVFRTTPEL
jgi:hypothetical protein